MHNCAPSQDNAGAGHNQGNPKNRLKLWFRLSAQAQPVARFDIKKNVYLCGGF
jgi:hypothetical protein